jgi:phosphoribosylglycinamide formyltransferase 1
MHIFIGCALPGQLNIAVFASGKGSNFQAILEAIQTGSIRNAQIVIVISNDANAGALAIARANDIPAVHMNRNDFPSDDEFNATVVSTLANHRVNFIVLAGYIKLIDASVVRVFQNRIVNIHPALLPKFGGPGMYGRRVHEAVIAQHEKISGATVHIVDEKYDHGPIVLQKTVPVIAGDTPESLAARVLQSEHQLYPEAIRLFAEGRIAVQDQQVTIQQ